VSGLDDSSSTGRTGPEMRAALYHGPAAAIKPGFRDDRARITASYGGTPIGARSASE
jgi:hypothetical protein